MCHWQTVSRVAQIVAGAAIMGLSINTFNLANRLAEGGVTGAAILLKLAFGLDPGLVTLVANIPLFVVGWRLLGRESLAYSVLGTAALSLFLFVFGTIRLPIDDMLLAAIFAGVGVGVGLGLIFRAGGTTGGVDILARLARKYWGLPVGRFMFGADVAVVGVSLVYLEPQQAMATVVAVFVGTRVIDFVQDSAYAARAAIIVSKRHDLIAERITVELRRGATILNGRGAWTGAETAVLYCVVGRAEVMRLKRLVAAIDPLAFVTVSEVHEVLGEGFLTEQAGG